MPGLYISRPCLYCSLLLVTIFATSGYWAPAPFLPLNGDWFVPPILARNQTGADETANEPLAFMMEVVGATASALGDAAFSEVKSAVTNTTQRPGLVSAGFNWLRAMSTKELRIPCVDVIVRL